MAVDDRIFAHWRVYVDYYLVGAMLILARRPGQTIVIGDDIEVTVLSVDGRVVRIGVTAPKDVRVDRTEIRDRIDTERFTE